MKLFHRKGYHIMKKLCLCIILSLSIFLIGCSNTDTTPMVVNSESIPQSTDKKEENYESYSGTWTQGGVSADSIITEGGAKLELIVTDGNKVKASVFTQQGTTERFADIEDITGTITDNSFDYKFEDDGWGGTGTLHFVFQEQSILMEVNDYQMAEENASGYGISGAYEFLKADSAEGTNQQKTGEADSVQPSGAKDSGIIEDQTFEMTLNPLGKVKFISYMPDIEQSPLADVVFKIQSEGKQSIELAGFFEDNIRTNEIFNKVEAVSFPDCNNDGYEDIVIICNYSPSSGPDVGTGYSEIRIYYGDSKGDFSLEKGLSETANSAIADKTVKAVLGFLGAGKNNAVQSEAFWQQSYMDYIQAQDQEQWQGYDLIYLDDNDIPELVLMGNSEAIGCKIVHFSNGGIHETQLDRLFFTYIERGNLLCNSEGNMDSYYDLVYSIVDGKFVCVASGYYGAQDNENVQFDKKGEPIYQYEFDGVKMSKEEYAKALKAVFDNTKATAPEHCYTMEEILQLCNSME